MKTNFLPILDLNRCDRCGICITACPENALVMAEQGPIIKDPTLCTYCTTCEEVCPQKAIRTPLYFGWSST